MVHANRVERPPARLDLRICSKVFTTQGRVDCCQRAGEFIMLGFQLLKKLQFPYKNQISPGAFKREGIKIISYFDVWTTDNSAAMQQVLVTPPPRLAPLSIRHPQCVRGASRGQARERGDQKPAEGGRAGRIAIFISKAVFATNCE